MNKLLTIFGATLIAAYLLLFLSGSVSIPKAFGKAEVPSKVWNVTVAGKQYQVRVGRQAEAQAEPQVQANQLDLSQLGDQSRVQWSLDLLNALGNTQPTIETVVFITAWQAGENTNAAFNPLATTQSADGATCFNYINGRCGVRNYTSREQGLQATIETITNGYYPNILAGLQTNQPELALNDGELGVWGTGGGNVRERYAEVLAMAQRVTDQVAVRQQLVDYALSLQGLQYVYGGRSTSGADCSGTMQLVYLTITGKDIGATTFSQYPALEPIELADIQPGDLWYGQYTDDQHTGMVADVDGDGKWDLINNGGLTSSMHVDYDFLTEPYFNQHTMGFRRAF